MESNVVGRLYCGLSDSQGQAVPSNVVREFQTYAATTLESFTWLPATGYWRGKSESSVVIESIGAESSVRDSLSRLARHWNTSSHQEACYLTIEPCQAELITDSSDSDLGQQYQALIETLPA